MNEARTFACALALLCLAATPALAGTRTFLFIPNVPGESLDDRHANWIDVQSVSAGVTAGICDGFTVQKYLDKASPLLSAAALNRMVYSTVTIESVKEGLEPRSFLTYTLESVFVHSVAVKQTTDDVMELVTLRPFSVTIAYRPQRADGSLDQAITSTVICKYK